MTKSDPSGPDFLAGGGEMGERIRRFDWSRTPLGPIERWPQSLKTAVRIMLGSRYQMFIWWGEQLINLYNDPYAPILGRRHPAALGQPAQPLWREIWDVLGPETRAVLVEQRATWNDRVRLIMERNGYPEETFFTWSYSPLPDDDGGVGGVFCVCYEETERVLSERRLSILRQLADDTAGAESTREACALAAQTLGKNSWDVSFALIYLLERDGGEARLCAAVGLPAGSEAAPLAAGLAAGGDEGFWPLGRALGGERVELRELNLRAALPGGAWPEPTHTAVVLPLAQGGQELPNGFVVFGASPRLSYDDGYQGFFELAASNIASALAKGGAFEEERRRAHALAEIDRAKTAFFSNVSHEFRTPLTLMLGPLEDALADSIEPRQRERLELLQRNALRLQKLVNSLLDFSRIEAGRIEASYQPTDLAELTAELASVFRSAVERAGMRLLVDCPPLPAPVYVDRDMYEKIVLNLLSNAFKFTLEGAIEVRLRDAGPAVELTVADTGSGIAGEQLPHIFERFHRIEGARARTHEGTGIGLALVNELVKLHGGSVAVASESGRGSSFTVRLPKGDGHLEGAGIAAPPRQLAQTALAPADYLEEALRWLPDGSAPAPGESSELAGGNRPLILWADDNADLRAYVGRLLAPHYEVQAVADGEAALAAVRRRIPDLILADVMMPRLDGFGLLHAVRQDERTRSLPVILLSARAGEESRVEGMAAGADDYLVKPFGARELVARVDAHLKLARQRSRAEQALRDSEQRYRTLFDSIDEGLAIVDLIRDDSGKVVDAFFVDVNAIFERQTGLPNMRGKLRSQAGPPVEPSWLEDLGEVAASGEPLRLERHNLALGRWFRVFVSRVGGDGSNQVAIVFEDISGRKHRERNQNLLAELTDELSRLETIPEMMERLGEKIARHFDLAWCNFVELSEDMETAVAGYGWNAPDVKALTGPYRLRDFLSSEQLATHLLGEPVIVSDTQNDRRVFAESYAALGIGAVVIVPLVRDRVCQFQLSILDRRTRIWRQDEIELIRELTQRMWTRLERARAEEVLRDSEAQLRARAAELQEADRRKNQFLAMLGHELRNPLAAIRSGVLLLRSEKAKPESRAAALPIVAEQVAHIERLVDDLLDLTRIVEGRVQVRRQPMALQDALRQALEIVRAQSETAGIDIEVDSPAAPLEILGDRVRLAQVFMNVLGNAVKYSGQSRRVEVAVAREGGEAVVRFRDYGVGISPELLPRIFDPFVQAAPGLTMQTGLGLGLAVVRQLVRLHDGEVEAFSAGESKGSEFVLRFPLCEGSP
jgi:signal transduction histidine kinase/FixJ family two-component response regulator